MPLLYVDVPALHDENPDDDLIALVNTFQWKNWQELRFLDTTSEGYRRGVSELASSLVEANRHLEETIAGLVTQEAGASLDVAVDNSPGFIDQLTVLEEAMPQMAESLNEITKNIQMIGQLMTGATEDVQRGVAQGKGFAARVIGARRLATQLSLPTENIWKLSNEYASQLHSVDEGIRVIIEHAPNEINDNPDSRENFCRYFESVRIMSSTAHEAHESGQTFINSLELIEKMSRDLRPVVRRLKQGLTIIVESKEISDDWIHLIDASGIECEGQDS